VTCRSLFAGMEGPWRMAACKQGASCQPGLEGFGVLGWPFKGFSLPFTVLGLPTRVLD